jgi:hypothetical protein
MATTTGKSVKRSATKAAKSVKRAAKVLKRSVFQGGKATPGTEGSSFSVARVIYKGKPYASLWQVWGKKGKDGCGDTGQDIGSRAQCITFRQQLRAARPGQPVTFKNEKPGHKGSGKVHVFRTVKPGEEA